MNEDDEDARLVAFIDGELDERARAFLEERLAIDSVLRERLSRLQEGDRPFTAAFEALLDEAPVQRLEASLAKHIQRRERPRPRFAIHRQCERGGSASRPPSPYFSPEL